MKPLSADTSAYSHIQYPLMKPQKLAFSIVAVLALAMPTASFAGKKKEAAAAAAAKPNPVMAKYDKNSNGALDDTEKEAIRAALGKDGDLAPCDKNKDGKLDDAELADITKASASTAEVPKKKKKKAK